MKSDSKKMSRRAMDYAVWIPALTVSFVTDVQAQNPITVSIVPYGGSSVTGGQSVAVEAFLTANEVLSLSVGQTDLPCSLPGHPGAVGAITNSGATIYNPGFPPGSIDGIPYLEGSTGFGDFNPATCIMDHYQGIAGVPINLSPGDVRFLATFRYNVSDCALGGFDVFVQSQTRFLYSAPGPPMIIPMDIVNAVLLVPGGTCCVEGLCLADNINEFCCQQTHPGARWIEGRSCADAIPCPDCVQDEDCDDAIFCNGAEHCDPASGTCQPSLPPTCDDGIACTVDSCDAMLDQCTNLPLVAECDDGLFCNGAEICDGDSGCQAGPPPSCDDGIACTIDGCDPFIDECVNIPSNVLCDDGITCTIDTCDASLDECVNSPSNAACDDGLFCNGEETCDADAGCQTGVPPCTGSVPVDGATVLLECDEATDACVVPPIPTVSTWGLVTLALMILTLAKLRRGASPEVSSR